MKRSICIFSGGYPTPDNPQFAFIKPFANAVADMGIECIVICPESITNSIVHNTKLRKTEWKDITKGGNTVTVLQPKYISLSLKFRGFNRFSMLCATKKMLKKSNIIPDAVFGHFWHSGVLANKVFPNTPLFVATGESEIWVNDVWDKRSIEKMSESLRGVISVSTENYEQSRQLKLCNENTPYIIAPNAVDESEFNKKDKFQIRKELGLNEESCIAIFVGAFSERKGVKRVVEAARTIKELKLILVGKGDEPYAESSQILYAGQLPHNEIGLYLNAADFFVLPTRAEGCCNAIVEALACGLPVISSKGKFNDDILDETCSLRIDPDSIEEINAAMKYLVSNPFERDRLSEGALKKATNLTINKRTRRIIDFIYSHI